MMALDDNVRSVQNRMAEAARRARRDPADITLVAVTKTHSPETIMGAYELGLRHFGENRVGEAEDKVHDLPQDITWHMIGHIQSRKANRVLPLFRFVHSLDSLKLARRLDRLAPADSPPLPVLLECNVSGEESKYGFLGDNWEQDERQWATLRAAVQEILKLRQLSVQGLMTMAPIFQEPEHTRPTFVRLRQLRDQLAETFPEADWHHLSMGMTDDFEVAIEEGATLVRIGRAIFDPAQPAWRKG